MGWNLYKLSLIKRKYLVLIKFSDEPADEEPVVAAPVSTGSKKKLINQFNFCERAALTYNNPSRVSFFLKLYKILSYVQLIFY